jgi:hypothetical protein
MDKYIIVRGSYHGTTDDRIDRWYIVLSGGPYTKRIGYRTKKEAREALKQYTADSVRS